MLFRVNTSLNKFYVFGLALLFTVALAGCGGGGGSKKAMDTDKPDTSGKTPQQMCEDAGGEYADMTCTTAAELDAAAAAGKTKAAGTKEEAIGDEAGQSATNDGGLGGSQEDGSPVTGYSYTVSRDRDGITVKVADTANPDADDDPQFSEAVNFDNGSMQVRKLKADDDGDVVEEVVVVRTDIAAPTARPFALDGDNKGVYTLDANPNEDQEAQSLEIDADTVAKAASDKFGTATGEGSVTLVGVDKEDTEDVKENEFRGSYDGAMGTYTCTEANGCMVTITKGKPSAVTGVMYFTADKDETVDVSATNYLTYGFWLKRTKDKDGVTTYNEVETFANAEGHPETGNSDLSGVTGSAKYEGGAAGVYVKNVTDNQGATVSATAGQFEAKVELNASFGGGAVAANNQFTIDGEVTDFTLHETDGPSVKNDDWGVSLDLTDFSGRATDNAPGKSAPGNSHDNEFSGVTTGDSTAARGTWNGAFYGSSASGDHDMDPDTPVTSPQPVAVIGEFNANFTDGTAAGGFGANKK